MTVKERCCDFCGKTLYTYEEDGTQYGLKHYKVDAASSLRFDFRDGLFWCKDCSFIKMVGERIEQEKERWESHLRHTPLPYRNALTEVAKERNCAIPIYIVHKAIRETRNALADNAEKGIFLSESDIERLFKENIERVEEEEKNK